MVYDLEERIEIAAVSFFSLNTIIRMEDMIKSIRRLYVKVRVEGLIDDPIVLLPEIPELVSYGNNNIEKPELDCVKKLQRYFKLKKMYLSTLLVAQNQEFRVDVYILATTKKILYKIYELKKPKQSDMPSLSAHSRSMFEGSVSSKLSISTTKFHLTRVLVAPLFTSSADLHRWQLRLIAEFLVENKLICEFGSFIADDYTKEELERFLEQDVTKVNKTMEIETFDTSSPATDYSQYYLDLMEPLPEPRILNLKVNTDKANDSFRIEEQLALMSMRSKSAIHQNEFQLAIQKMFTLMNFDPIREYRIGIVPADTLTEESIETPIMSWKEKSEFDRLNMSSEMSKLNSQDDDLGWRESELSSPYFEADYVIEEDTDIPDNIMETPEFDCFFTTRFDPEDEGSDGVFDEFTKPQPAMSQIGFSPASRIMMHRKSAVRNLANPFEKKASFRSRNSSDSMSNHSRRKGGMNQIIIKNLGVLDQSFDRISEKSNNESGNVKASLDCFTSDNKELLYPLQVSFRKRTPSEQSENQRSSSSSKNKDFEIRSRSKAKCRNRSPEFLSPDNRSRQSDKQSAVFVKPRRDQSPQQKTFSTVSKRVIERKVSQEIDFDLQSPLLISSPRKRSAALPQIPLFELKRTEQPESLSPTKSKIKQRSIHSINLTDSFKQQNQIVINPRGLNIQFFKPIAEPKSAGKSQSFFAIKKKPTKVSLPSLDDSIA